MRRLVLVPLACKFKKIAIEMEMEIAIEIEIEIEIEIAIEAALALVQMLMAVKLTTVKRSWSSVLGSRQFR
jgi:hypothetical protein